ncbi:hypothetical protein [Brevibacterium permense]|uniref:Uncharacterized protein n=1 Tax=Brevibacterium permense TaxID=234834 RepID=A0ABN2A9L7_9MICO|nr:hypothetical protein [Brevibacterium permense]
MTTPAPTPATIRRNASINQAITDAERLAAVLRQYRGAQRDGFPMSHLARVEAVLEQAINSVFDMTAGERRDLVEIGTAAAEDERLRIAAARPIRPVGFRPEPTLPASAVLHAVSAGDCD